MRALLSGGGKLVSTNVLMLTSTLPRHQGDMQADFVGEQARAWHHARPEELITILAPHHAGAARREAADGVVIERFRYLLPESWQRLAYPAILPNLKRNPLLTWQIAPFIIGEYLAAERLVRRDRPRLIYAHWVMPQGLVAWWLLRSTGTPYILQNHSSDLAMFTRLGAIGRKLARRIIRDAAHFFCVNALQREAALALFPECERAALAQRIAVLPMGIDMAPAPAPTSDAFRYDIGTIGRLSRKKGLHHLINAAELLAQRGIRPRIAIAGDGEERARLQSLVKAADIHFTGFLAGDAKTSFVAGCARFAFPAVAAGDDVEGLPVALLEVLSRGAPVLASRDTNIALLPEWHSIREAVTFVENPADIATLADALAALAARPAGSAGTVAGVVDRYRWDRLIAEYLAAIDTAQITQG